MAKDNEVIIREIGGRKYEFIKTKCTCHCHQTGITARHIIACCQDGFKFKHQLIK